jgi:acetylglutamate kinase
MDAATKAVVEMMLVGKVNESLVSLIKLSKPLCYWHVWEKMAN